MPQVNLSEFDKSGLERGRSRGVEIAWWLARVSIVQTRFPWPSIFRKAVLTLFGAKVGKNFYCRPELAVHFPWKLEIGDNVWLGERTVLHNIEHIYIGSNTALGHEVFITSGGHDVRSRLFSYKNQEVHVGDQVWIGSRATILAGVQIGQGTVVAAGSVVTKPTEAWSIYGGVPARKLRARSLVND